MKWIRLQTEFGVSFGILEGQYISLVNGGLFDDIQFTGEKIALEKAKLLVPLEPKTFYAAGLNYAEHVIEQAKANRREPMIPQAPHIGYRANNALIAHNEPIVKPRDASDEFQYEGELAVIIGKTARNISEQEALEYVFGYSIGNDVSERKWQREDRTMWRAKNTDTFKPMGPWIETNVNLDDLTTVVRVNETEMISFKTNNMIFGVERFISAMSQYLTLFPGDMIWMGTEGHSKNLSPGDICEIEITGIGALRNPVILSC
ncbi:MAG: 2-keto-4-pentenoate hydratase [Rhodospirillaceae bacterium]|nr:2-keto-4-pentenoate hydratase [Rhodospirillaceae bacterium]